MNFKIQDLIKFTVAIVVAVIGTTAWMDSRFITTLEAKEFVKTKRVDKIERMITFQELQVVWKDIEAEEKKPNTDRNNDKLKIYYMQEQQLKEQLGVK